MNKQFLEGHPTPFFFAGRWQHLPATMDGALRHTWRLHLTPPGHPTDLPTAHLLDMPILLPQAQATRPAMRAPAPAARVAPEAPAIGKAFGHLQVEAMQRRNRQPTKPLSSKRYAWVLQGQRWACPMACARIDMWKTSFCVSSVGFGGPMEIQNEMVNHGGFNGWISQEIPWVMKACVRS